MTENEVHPAPDALDGVAMVAKLPSNVDIVVLEGLLNISDPVKIPQVAYSKDKVYSMPPVSEIPVEEANASVEKRLTNVPPLSAAVGVVSHWYPVDVLTAAPGAFVSGVATVATQPVGTIATPVGPVKEPLVKRF